jgi:hypothetical protein
MGLRIILVKSCLGCPFHSFRYNNEGRRQLIEWVCLNVDLAGRYLGDVDSDGIPVWCPLESYDEYIWKVAKAARKKPKLPYKEWVEEWNYEIPKEEK